jgi:ribosomal protein L32
MIILPPGKRHRRPQIPLRELGFQKTSLDKKRGRRNAERRTLVTAAACFPNCRKTEAHGNASQRSTTAIF